MWRGTDRQTHGHTDGRGQYKFRLGECLARNVTKHNIILSSIAADRSCDILLTNKTIYTALISDTTELDVLVYGRFDLSAEAFMGNDFRFLSMWIRPRRSNRWSE